MELKITLSNIVNFAFNKVIQVFGVVIIVFGLIFLLSLISYSPNDPNFVFPNENECEPGDFFRENQIKELENFLNYKNFNFQISKTQSLFNYISLISFLISVSFIMYYLIRKIIYK